MKTIVIAIASGLIGLAIGAGLAYNDLSYDLLDCRLALEQTNEYYSEE